MDIAAIVNLLKDASTQLKDAGTAIESFGKAGSNFNKILKAFGITFEIV